MSRILFVGSFVSNELEQKSKYISSAGNRFQNNVIEHLEKAGHQVMRMSYLGVPLTEEELKMLPVYCMAKRNNLLQSVRYFRSWMKREIQNVDIVMCYNVIYAWLNLPKLARKYGKRSIVILADYSDERSFSSWKLKLYSKLQRSSIRKFDKVVGLSKNISLICKSKQTFLRMEGGIDETFFHAFDKALSSINASSVTYMYSGLLSKVTGVDILLDAFSKFTIPNVHLVVTGKGQLEEQVKLAAKKDSRINYLGSVPYEQYIELLKQADVLVNPRNMKLPENQNNFPSKVMDYLATGRPIVSTRFAGWEEFREYILFADADASDIFEKMQMVVLEPNRFQERRSLSKDYLWEKQIAKIVSE